jgi:hypothetical protein
MLVVGLDPKLSYIFGLHPPGMVLESAQVSPASFSRIQDGNVQAFLSIGMARMIYESGGSQKYVGI